MPPSTLMLQAYLLGWSVAAPIGPVNLEIVRRSLRHRLAAGLCVGLGATMIDAGYMLLTSFGLSNFLQTPAVLLVSFVAGGVLMAWLAGMALRDAWRYGVQGHDVHLGSKEANSEASGASRRILLKSWIVGLGMTATNPMTLAYWATLPGLFFHGADPSPGEILAATCFVWLGTISWVGTLMAFLLFGKRFVGDRLFAIASGAGGLVMGYFAMRFWWLAIHFDAVAKNLGTAA